MTMGDPAPSHDTPVAPRWPLWLALLLFAGAILVIRPWGEFPLNDDWQYASVCKRFAETGQFFADYPQWATLFGQCLIAAPVIKLFGFSHLVLRLTTLGMAAVLLLVVDGILRQGGVLPRIRAAALAILIFNPLFLNLSTSFMTEVYGFTLALAGAWIWLRSRGRPGGLSWAACLASALLIGASYWVRQFSILIFPALVLAAALPILIARDWARWKALLPKLVGSGTVLVAIVLLYLVWMKTSSNNQVSTGMPWRDLLWVSWKDSYGQVAVYWIYMTAFLFPLFFLLPLRQALQPSWGMALFFVAELVGLLICYQVGQDFLAAPIQRGFPLLHNVIYDTGVGPLLLTDVYFEGRTTPMRHPEWPRAVWWAIYACLVALCPIWWTLLRRMVREARARWTSIRTEVLLFGLFLSLVLLAVTLQAFKQHVFDRYHFGTFLGLLIAGGVLLGQLQASARSIARLAGALLLLVFFSVAGTRDYFRWNELRWTLARELMSRGIPGSEIDGGHEFNGWVAQSGPVLGRFPTDVEHYRRLPYRIVMNPTPGYTVLSKTPVPGWLVRFPPLLVEKKQ